MDRRGFLRLAGVGTAAAASVPFLRNVALGAEGQWGWRFTALSHLGSDDVVEISGSGAVTPSNIVGEGSLLHWRLEGSPPYGIVSTGTWKATQLLDFSLVGTYGPYAAGWVEMRVNFVLSSMIPESATMKIVCNLPAGGLDTGSPEGVFLTVAGGTFAPFIPARGLAVITIENEKRNL